jgi:large subunit ribosomal protein LP2
MKELATYLLLKLGGNAAPTADDVTAALTTVGVEVDADRLSALLTDLEGKDLNEVIASGSALLAKFGGGGGGGGGG